MSTLAEIDALIAAGDHRDAINATEAELVAAPDSAALQARLAAAYVGLPSEGARLELHAKVLDRPYDVGYVGALIEVLIVGHESNEAIRVAKRLVGAVPHSAGSHRLLARALHHRGVWLQKRELVGHALGSIRTAVELAPDDELIQSVHDRIDADLRVMLYGRNGGFGFGPVARWLASALERRVERDAENRRDGS